MVRRAFKALGILLALSVVPGVVAHLYLINPSVVETYERLSNRPVTQEVVYSTPCDPGGPGTYVEGEEGLRPLYLHLAAGLRDLEGSDYAVPGNRFVLEGYRVARKWNGKVLSTSYFDVLSWKPIPPYATWRRVGTDVIRETSRAPVEFRTSEPSPKFEPTYSANAVC